MTPTEHCRVELKVPNDPRALGAVRGALQHTARHLGFSPHEEEELIALTDRLIRGAFASISADQSISILIQEHPDRVELEFVRPARGTEKWIATKTLPGIDEMKEETSNGLTHLKLVKFHSATPQTPPSPN